MLGPTGQQQNNGSVKISENLGHKTNPNANEKTTENLHNKENMVNLNNEDIDEGSSNHLLNYLTKLVYNKGNGNKGLYKKQQN